MAKSWNTTRIGHFDCAGGGQVWIDGTTMYVGHMRNPAGTTIVDVADPRKPKILAQIAVPEGWHSHKVRVANDIMLVNRERTRGDLPNADFVGLRVFDNDDMRKEDVVVAGASQTQAQVDVRVVQRQQLV